MAFGRYYGLLGVSTTVWIRDYFSFSLLLPYMAPVLVQGLMNERVFKDGRMYAEV